ncbi:UDP-N-acetylmuramoylalanine--D-glutamate ligase [bioreactor metagenome]|uniref:UDP-N-acetylmuramoylalanine--D-glutamate ligase n=1 Tax=bioreactor metagenome TaxID=1076179 RepID=A0A644U3B0_9ZZZZ|nr:UDP-N-acetylmuramoyl-L-alanine--D-glutamate ligase [Bacteroidales bacterium]MBP6455008.1 UDP-N-acetylmuramoyl-L-alanine--D-glutamate ligase [Bacteroidales bacterium]WRQ33931.1 UDP-N-acetylmuramoyl-L-alanine--D-glutamate ligase [Bacteroidales bacterium MB20-C3-3]
MSKVVVLGGGESGVGAAVLAIVKGHETFLSDCNMLQDDAKAMLERFNIPYEEGGHTRERILDADEVIKSPGIPDTVPIMDEIFSVGIPVISEIEFAGRYDSSKKICITGSNGKTTTTSIIYFLMKNAGLNVGLAGNIGQSYAFQVATKKHDYYVLELSSFQLEGMYEFKADIAVLLNITPDHLDRYDNKMENYIKAKFRITRNMSSDDCFIFCADDEISISHLNKIVLQAKQLPFSQTTEVEEGAYMKDEQMHVVYNSEEYTMFVNELSLQGKHNIYNSMAAAITGKVLKISNNVLRESLSSFKGVEHRLENVLKVKNVLYINDSKATNVNSTWYALESMKTNIVWIAGGKDKGNDYTPLYDLVKDKVRVLICMGVNNTRLHEEFGEMVDEIYDAGSAKEAVEIAYRCAKPGESVLLSPACASFDLFRNYEDRGKQFKEAVASL